MNPVLMLDQDGVGWVPVSVAALRLDAALTAEGYKAYLAVRPDAEFPAQVHLLPLRAPTMQEVAKEKDNA